MKMQKQRIEYLDALRGLAMLFVVMGHISMFTLDKSYLGFEKVTVSLEIPLFFLISGFFAYKPIEKWTKHQMWLTIRRRFITFIVSALIFMFIFEEICLGGSFDMALFNGFKHGYWFTITLFTFIMIYFISIFVLKPLIKRNLLYDSVLLMGGGIILFTGIYFQRISETSPLINLFGLTHLNNYIYFILGVLWHKHYEAINSIIRNTTFITIVCLVFFFGNIYTYSYATGLTYLGPSSTIYFLILIVAGLILAVRVFQQYEVLSGNNIFGRFIKMCGTWSIEIYFIHYFLLPRNMQYLGKFLEEYPNNIIEFGIVFLIAVFVIYNSYFIGKVISVSTFLSSFLFGKRRKVEYEKAVF